MAGASRLRRPRRGLDLAGSVATLLSAALLPIDAAITVGAGIGVTCVTYVFMAVMRWSIEVAGQPDW